MKDRTFIVIITASVLVATYYIVKSSREVSVALGPISKAADKTSGLVGGVEDTLKSWLPGIFG